MKLAITFDTESNDIEFSINGVSANVNDCSIGHSNYKDYDNKQTDSRYVSWSMKQEDGSQICYSYYWDSNRGPTETISHTYHLAEDLTKLAQSKILAAKDPVKIIPFRNSQTKDQMKKLDEGHPERKISDSPKKDEANMDEDENC